MHCQTHINRGFHVTYFADIAAVIAEHIDALRSTGALLARPGRRLDSAGYPTPERVIVLGFAPNARPTTLPATIGGFAIDARELSDSAAQFYGDSERAERAAISPPEVVPSQIPGEVVLAQGSPNDAVPASAAPTLAYTPPPNVSLDPLTLTDVTMICSVSPDNGWLVLESFLAGTTSALTVAMYDWTSAHIEQAAAKALAGKSLLLVLDNPAKDPTADQTDEQTVGLLTTALGSGFAQQWALTPRDPEHGTPIFESAYHIKVAVRDTGGANSAVWISSGNWDNSNQPVFDPANPDLALAQSSDRDWHIIIENDALATTFKAFIDHDYTVAQAANAAATGAAPTVSPLPLPPAVVTKGFTTFVGATTIQGDATLTPLFTPDPGVYVDRITALFNAAQTSIDLQFQYITSFAESTDAPFAGMIHALAAAEARGVAIRMIYSEFQQQSVLELLSEAGVAIDNDHVRIQNNVHNKGILIDGHLTVVSSQNWSGAGVLRNRDAGLIIDNAAVNAYYLARFTYDWTTLATASPSKS
jgi:hypothetical protein